MIKYIHFLINFDIIRAVRKLTTTFKSTQKNYSFLNFSCFSSFADSPNRRHHASVPVKSISKPFFSSCAFRSSLFIALCFSCMLRFRYHEPIKIIFVSGNVKFSIDSLMKFQLRLHPGLFCLGKVWKGFGDNRNLSFINEIVKR